MKHSLAILPAAALALACGGGGDASTDKTPATPPVTPAETHGAAASIVALNDVQVGVVHTQLPLPVAVKVPDAVAARSPLKS